MKLLDIFEKRIVLISLALFIMIYFVFFPSFFASIDEHEYIRNAYLLQKGTLVEKDASAACTGKFNGDGYVNQYFIGRSLFLIPFTWFGLFGIMLSGLVLHLLNFFVFYKILGKIGSEKKYSLFYLLYPAFFWSARTLNSELFVLSGLLAGIYFYLSEGKKDWAISGLFFGISVLGRYDAAIIVLPFILLPIIKNRQKLGCILCGFLPVLAILFLFNYAFYGGILSTGYGNPLNFVTRIFDNTWLLKSLIVHITILMIAYPLLLLSPLKAHRLRKEVIIAAALYILFYSYNADPSVYTFLSPVTFTGRLRYLIPVIGLLMIFYGNLYESAIKKIKLPEKRVFTLTILCLLAVYVAASFVHAKFLDDRYYVYNQLYSSTPDKSLLIGSGEVCTFVLPQLFGNRSYSDIGNKTINNFTGSGEYLVDIFYSTVDPSTHRGGLVASSSKEVTSFIEENKGSLIQVFNSTKPHKLGVYKIVGSG